MIAAAHTHESVRAAIDDSERFLIQQVFRPIGNEYRISVPTPGSKDVGQPLLFVKQTKDEPRGGGLPTSPSRTAALRRAGTPV